MPKDICGLRTVPEDECKLDTYCVWDTSKGCITDENNVKDFNQVNILSTECGGINEKEKKTCEQKKEKCEWIDNTDEEEEGVEIIKGCFNKQNYLENQIKPTEDEIKQIRSDVGTSMGKMERTIQTIGNNKYRDRTIFKKYVWYT